MHLVLRIICTLALLTCSGSGAAAIDSPDQEALARRLLNSQGCKACHAFEGGKTETGPGLVEISKSLNRTELTRSLVNPDHVHGRGMIPDFSHLRTEEVNALVTFLHNLLPEGERTTPNLRVVPNESTTRNDISKP